MKERKAKTLSAFEFMQKFPDDETARKYFEARRWRNGKTCPKCGGTEKIKARKRVGYYRCGDCRSDFTAKSGTVLEHSNISIRKWLYAIYLVVTARKGVSSLQLSKEIGVTQKTAWFMLQRIREACGGDYSTLSGIVEIDESYFGGKKRNRHFDKKQKTGRGPVGKQAVLGMRERQGRTRAMPIEKTDGKTLHGAIYEHIQIGSTIYTDEHRGYLGLDGLLYNHGSVKHSAKEYVNGMIYTNGIESVWALLKRGYTGTFHHFSFKHIQKYLNEFTFRLNQGACDIDTIDRINSLCDNLCGKRLKYRDLIA